MDGEKPKRQREVAQICGISRSYISRIEKRALFFAAVHPSVTIRSENWCARM
ncbi:MAG: helix-turn-helix domain-containing protein, partial [Lachnospiraceae bacterium]|nr:helix-turn-helix domain-containing protein [Lachnospiraceae bacterium]